MKGSNNITIGGNGNGNINIGTAAPVAIGDGATAVNGSVAIGDGALKTSGDIIEIETQLESIQQSLKNIEKLLIDKTPEQKESILGHLGKLGKYGSLLPSLLKLLGQ